MPALTGIRGIAALYVMLFHARATLPYVPGRLTMRGYLAVDLFFVLSGFVIAANYARDFDAGISLRASARFLARRVARIYPLYLALLIGLIAAQAAGAIHMHPELFRPRLLLANLLLLQAWGLGPSTLNPAWSVSAECASYILFPLLLVPCCRGGQWTAVAAAVASLGLLAAMAHGPAAVWAARQPLRGGALDLSGPYSAAPVLRCLAGFSLGLVAWRFRSRVPAWAADPLCLGIVAMAATTADDVAIVALIAPAIAALSWPGSWTGRVLSGPVCLWLGAISYPVYLIHTRFGAIVTGLPRHMVGLPPRLALSVALIVYLAAVLATATIAHRAIEVPCRAAIKRWARRRTGARSA